MENCIVEAPVGSPVKIGDEAIVSHGAIAHGATVGAGALVGIGSIVLDGTEVGGLDHRVRGVSLAKGRDTLEHTRPRFSREAPQGCQR